ncbi:MAG: DNA primase [Candidatus Aenigmatarchaeota archaeon]
MIPQTFIDEVQSKTDIVELINSYFPLKHSGRNFRALCPFHSEKNPSFFVSPQKQIFHCFSCGEGGGPIQFVMLYERVSFVEAIEILAKRLGLKIPYENREREKQKNTLYQAVNEASLFFHRSLLVESSKPILIYLKKRGIEKEAIEKFRIGYAIGKKTLMDYLRKKGFSLDVLEKTSLVVSTSDGYRDFFNERIIFPIFDLRSRVLGFGARLWQEREDLPKYINSLESSIYSKREHLFGFNFSKEDVLKNDCAIIVEGYLDMIIPFINGIRNIVASLGTALTIEQINLIKRYTKNIILVFDPDRAGETATLRSLDLLLENDLKVRIAKLPSGFDPDSFVREKGKDNFLEILNKSLNFFDYKIEVLKNTYDVESIVGKTKIAQDFFNTLDKLTSEIEKYEYIKLLSQELKIREEILIAEFRNFTSKNRGRTFSSNNNSKISEPLSLTEKVLLKFMLVNNKAFSIIKNNLEPQDFNYPLAKKTVAYFFEKYHMVQNGNLANLIGSIEDKEISGFVSKILIDDDIPLEKEIFKDSLEKLRKKKIKSLKNNLLGEIKEAEKNKDKERLKKLIEKYNKIRS